MLHKLALVTSVETPSLIKEALPTPEQEMFMKAKLDLKARAMAEARSVDIPLVETETWNPKTKQMDWDMKPDTDNVRMNQRADPTQAVAEGVTPTSQAKPKVNPITGQAALEANPNAGKAVSKPHTVPGGSVNPRQGSALIEKEIQQAHGEVSNSTAKKLKHTYVGGAKRFWGGKGLTGNKWGNRGAAVAGVGALGLGINAYLNSRKIPQEGLAGPEGPQSMEQPYPPQYAKTGADIYSPSAVTVPKPTPQPQVPALGPGIKPPKALGGPTGTGLLGSSSPGSNAQSTAGIKQAENFPGTSTPSGTPAFMKQQRKFKAQKMKRFGTTLPPLPSIKQAEDPGVLPLVGAAAGGAGGYMIGKKLLQPALAKKEQTVLAEIAKSQAKLKNLNKMTSAAPLGAAAAGALLLAALAALYAKRSKDRPKQVRPVRPYDPTGAGFQASGYNPFGNFYG